MTLSPQSIISLPILNSVQTFQTREIATTPQTVTMPLKLLPITLPDFDTMISHATTYAPGDDLVGPPTPICWPVTTQPSAHARLEFHMSAQRRRFLGDRSATYLKVVDEETGEIVSMARWHFYPNGYSYEEGIGWEVYRRSGEEGGIEIPTEMNINLHNHILSTRDAERQNWQSPPSPCWILMHLVTRPSQRGRGAAGMLVQWGVERARGEGVSAFLEAGIKARGLYERFGFAQVGLLGVDLRGCGVDMEFEMVKMELRAGKGDRC